MDIAAAFNAALAAQNAGELESAERGYRALLAQAPHTRAMHNLGILLEQSGRFAEAGEVLRLAVTTAPESADHLKALAAHYKRTRQFALAEPLYRRLLAAAPDDDEIAVTLGVALLAEGRREGWTYYDRREARLNLARQNIGMPEWQGEPLAGKRLFIYREQGFGDQIMMARFLPRLGAAQITYMGPPPLERLFGHFPLTWKAWAPGNNQLEWHDYWTLPYSIPRHVEGAYPNEPYLFGDASRRPAPAGARIGVIWTGEPRNDNNRFRSLPQDQAQRLLALPGAIGLEPAETGAKDFQDTADLIAGLDLVITVDTAVSHLAGAMGKPVWVVLAQRAIDWQWPRTGGSPWYPSARLFPQPRPNDWAGAVDAVLEALKAEGFAR